MYWVVQGICWCGPWPGGRGLGGWVYPNHRNPLIEDGAWQFFYLSMPLNGSKLCEFWNNCVEEFSNLLCVFFNSWHEEWNFGHSAFILSMNSNYMAVSLDWRFLRLNSRPYLVLLSQEISLDLALIHIFGSRRRYRISWS